jgi:hypothetical protein
MPLSICQTTFKTDTIRIELDTRTVKDWNELDYVQLIGSLALPQGVLEGNQLVYVPDVDAFGEDTFSYAVSDCAFQPKRQSLPGAVSVRILPVNDPPIASNKTISDIGPYMDRTQYGPLVASFDLLLLCSDVDNDPLVFTIEQAEGTEMIAWIEGHTVLIRWTGVAASLPNAAHQGFGLRYSVQDPNMASAHGFITFWPSCDNGVKDGTRCIPCPAGTRVAKDQEGRVECRPCNPGQFQKEEGQYSCISCDSLGDFYQEQSGQTFCNHCVENTQRYVGVLSAGSKAACQCRAGAIIAGSMEGPLIH